MGEVIEIAARIRYAGKSLAQAAADVIAGLALHGGDGELIAVGPSEPPVLPINSSGMYRGFAGADGVLRTAIHREAFRTYAP